MSYLVLILLQHHTDLIRDSAELTNQRRHLTLLITFLSVAAAIAFFLLG